MRPRFTRVAHVLLVLVPLLAVGCAGGGGPGAGTTVDVPPDAFVITVQNNMPGAGNITVLLDPAAGVQAQLGQVGPGQTQSFTRTESPGSFRLVARTAEGERRSQQFQVYRGSEAVWDLQANRVIVRSE